MNDIIKKYPKIFKDYKGNPGRVNWSCPKGWWQILDWLCGSIQSYIDNTRRYDKEKKDWCPPDQVECVQVKEKFGSLRFYTVYHDKEVEGMIKMAEYMTLQTCQDCGSHESLGETKGWISVLCEDCKENYNLNWVKRNEKTI